MARVFWEYHGLVVSYLRRASCKNENPGKFIIPTRENYSFIAVSFESQGHREEVQYDVVVDVLVVSSQKGEVVGLHVREVWVCATPCEEDPIIVENGLVVKRCAPIGRVVTSKVVIK